ncbi:MAG: hypothetical protein GX272_08415 [Epulopiscium sp.]|nr:hypothetical protein [Candidatus Epulonipiscium sp.]
MSVNTQKLGKAIFEYFLQRTSPNERFTLCIDTYTYEHCAHQAGITDKEIENLLKGEGTDYIGDSYSALAIVALETKIAYDVETDSDLVNSYNNRLIEKLKYFYDNNSVQQFYRDWQDEIWFKSKKLFEKEKRYLDIPAPRSGPGCYVQYPVSQRIINGTSIIRYADRFIQLNLEPSSGITYQIFEGLVFNRNEYSYNTMIRRMVFSFYCVWDGRCFSDILNRKKSLTREQIEQKAKDEFCIQTVPEIKFYINKRQIDLSKERIEDKYLWRFDENKYLTRRGTFFIKDSDYNDWLPYNRAIDADEELLLLTTQSQYPSYVENLRSTDEIEVLSAGLYKILILRLRDREEFEAFRIPVKTQPYFSLLGGLKIKRNTYYPFALPSIVLTDQEYDKTKYTSVYLDAKEYPIVDGKAQIPEKLNPGKHCLKLLNSWDSSEMFFSVESVSPASIPENHGWVMNEVDGEMRPSSNIGETVIDGLRLNGNLGWIERKPIMSVNQNDTELRPFLFQKERLENRFQLNRRSHYGNY